MKENKIRTPESFFAKEAENEKEQRFNDWFNEIITKLGGEIYSNSKGNKHICKEIDCSFLPLEFAIKKEGHVVLDVPYENYLKNAGWTVTYRYDNTFYPNHPAIQEHLVVSWSNYY